MKILDRINELANKEKVQPLTVAEKQEQHALRQDYLSMIRGQVSINNIFHNKSG